MPTLAEILGWKYNFAPRMRTRENPETGTMEIFDWPVDELGPEPTSQQIKQWATEYVPPLDPDTELFAAIEAATDLQGLKDALLGRAGRGGKVKGQG